MTKLRKTGGARPAAQGGGRRATAFSLAAAIGWALAAPVHGALAQGAATADGGELASAGARAGAGAWAEGAVASARLLPAGAAESGALQLLLEVDFPDDWVSYWRHPGESGVPPRLDWAGDARPAAVVWPTPTQDEVMGARVLQYEGGFALVAELPGGAPEGAEVTLSMIIGVCQEVCLPERFELAATASAAAAAGSAETVAAVRASAPRAAAAAGWTVSECAGALVMSGSGPHRGAWAVAEGPEGPAEARWRGGALHVWAEGAAASALRVTLFPEDGATPPIEQRGC